MKRQGQRTLPAVLTVMLVLAGGASGFGGFAASSAVEPEPVENQPERIRDGEPRLASDTLRSAVADLRQGRSAGSGVSVIDGRVLVDVRHNLDSTAVRTLIEELGGHIYAELDGVLLEAFVPFDRIVELEGHPGVRYLRPPSSSWPVLPPEAPLADAASTASPILGEEVTKTRADVWHSAGVSGAGVKVGIIDYFNATYWDAAQTAGEVPEPSGEFCRLDGAACNIWSHPSDHGTAVAEIIHEMAPDAELYVAFASTPGDYLQAIDYFASQGVVVVNNSKTAEYDGPGDGTGQRAGLIDYAVSSGIAWFNSAGNEAGGGGYGGSYWRGEWTDTDGDGWLEFAPGDEELNLWCDWANGFRWNDWTDPSPSDYDIFLFDDPADLVGLGDYPADYESALSRAKAHSWDVQAAGADPVENYNARLASSECAGDADLDYLRVGRWDPGGGSTGDVLEFMLLQKVIEHWQNPYSASGPYSDTGSPGGVSVGAIDPPIGTEIGTYSSWGPTNDGRTKPDLSAAAGVASFTKGTFKGTSASSPTAAGAAALIVDAGLATTPSEVKSYLLDHATTDRGAAGGDNIYGRGELILPDPPDDAVGPLATSVVADPSPAFDDEAVTVTANIDDSTTGGANVAGAVLSPDGGLWDQMAASDGVFDEVAEPVIGSLAPLSAGSHQLCVRGVDALGNQGSEVCTTLQVLPADDEAPFVWGVEASPEPALTGQALILTANVDDIAQGDSIIASATWNTDYASGNMAAVDGAFDEIDEQVTATLPAFTTPRLEEVCVTGTDASGNSDDSCTLVDVNGAALGTVARLAGSDRYSTATALSAATFGWNVPVAYVAVGDNFPDALAAGPVAAIRGGPILLTQTDTLPFATQIELIILGPQSIVVVGGPAAVSDAVLGQLRQYTSGSVTRLAGTDRYRTAVEISKAAFGPGVPMAYVAVGDNFPDALAAGPVAAIRGGPILLTQTDALPNATKQELSRLSPKSIVVVGGPAAVSDAVLGQLRQYTSGSVTRLAGTDRYRTAAEISKAAFGPGVPMAYIAVGDNFPDALAGGPVAGLHGGPILLTQRDALPNATRQELSRIRPLGIVVVGGTGVISAAVETELAGYLPP